MKRTAAFSTGRRRLGIGLVGLAAVAALVVAMVAGAGTAAGASKRVVKVGESSKGDSVLANLSGRTLYSLSVEKHGKFICVGGCLKLWHPLVVAKGTKPTGPVTLGTVKRPDGRMQVTYRGLPLYRFVQDSKAGETNGEGIKDVGTWHAAKPSASAAMQGTQSEQPSGAQAPSAPPAEAPSYGY